MYAANDTEVDFPGDVGESDDLQVLLNPSGT